MFDSPAAARQALEDAFEPSFVEAALHALVPAIVLIPIDEGTALGGTRIGGSPDLPAGFEWPKPSPPDDPESLARRGNADAAAAMRAHLALNPPFAFFAQVDLGEAAALGSVAAELPSEGRLLFFYDLAVGPWENSSRVARVLWDCAPRDTLKLQAAPEDLAVAAENDRRAVAEAFSARGLQAPSGEAGTVYGAPSRPATPAICFQLPAPHSLEIATMPLIATCAPAAMSEDESTLYFDYSEFLDEHGSSRDACHLLLGLPMPEQDDPRYDAVVATTFGKQHLSREEWAQHREAIFAAALDWRPLLQINVSDWSQDDLAEGAVYFLIRRTDLAARRFDGVVAVYQQT